MKIDFVNEFASAVIHIQLGTFIWRRRFVGRNDTRLSWANKLFLYFIMKLDEPLT